MDREGPELEVVQLGNPLLRRVSEPVIDPADPVVRTGIDRLQRTLRHFRAVHGFGRAISAPQVGLSRRVIALCLPGAPELVVNPVVTWSSPETFTMWDDCMSFPFLLVKLRRSASISIRFTDERSREQSWDHLDQATSELLQHEIDHLDGILAVDRALDRDSLISRSEYEARREDFARQVDYVIG